MKRVKEEPRKAIIPGIFFPIIDKSPWFYKNSKRQRKVEAKICQVCPFKNGIEKQEKK